MHDTPPGKRLLLTGLEPFARGGGRDCYAHPQDSGLCVKVAREGRSPEERRQGVAWWKRWRKSANKYDDSLRDFQILKALESDADSVTWQHIPRCLGWVETDRGRGLVTDLIRDADGLISRNLLEYLWTNHYDDRVQAAVDEFARFWESGRIPSRSLFLDNIAAQVRSDGTLRLVVIDGLGSTVLIPWYTWSTTLGRIWARRKIQELRRDIAIQVERRRTQAAPSKATFLHSRR
ncbi:MAG TPA: YrbL family protein [Thiobacillaceae bacterium]|nr:YrbL family protein [Thiobacillaceae bacterium]HNG55573.1 YrbL family protein [Nitrospira sp.]